MKRNVRYWHKADIETALRNVRFWGNSGHRVEGALASFVRPWPHAATPTKGRRAIERPLDCCPHYPICTKPRCAGV
jgi:hypothetical protein